MLNPFRSKKPDQAELDEAMSALRGAAPPEERLSARARGIILQETLGVHAARPAFASLFLPTRKLLVLSGIPAAAVFAFLVVLTQISPQGADRPTGVTAEKQGDQIVFTIANGRRSHTVTRSTDPAGLKSSDALRVEGGSFVDSTAEGPDLVFYRVE